jgi:diketogulonate reductase-like aldo/keto reductase
LQLDYLDLYLVHWPVAFKFGGLRLDNSNTLLYGENKEPLFEKVSLETTWHAMEGLVHKDLVKSIGVSNYTYPFILDILSYCKIPPAVNQIELHPYFTRPELTGLCKRNGIALTAYSPLGSGKTGPLQDETVEINLFCVFNSFI